MRLYFDYAASTPVDPEVRAAMQPYFSKKFGNPGSLHSFGQEAIAAVDNSRETIAKAIGADFREIIFTGSATEANNLALRGALKGFRFQVLGFSDRKNKNLTPNTYNLKPRIIVSAIEHESILETAKDLERDGVEVVYLPVDKNGLVGIKKLEDALNERTVLVSVMYANNEIGTIQPISAIAEIVREFRIKNLEFRDKTPKSYILNPNFYPLFHTDAVQAFQFLDCGVKKLGVDLMTLSAHKIYGPKGVGALYVRHLKPNTYNLKPLIMGGGQEFGLRSGTENVPLIVGFAKAVRLVAKNREEEGERIAKLRNYFWLELKKFCPQAEINGGKNTVPSIINVYFPGYSSSDLLTNFDLAGLAASAGSACSARSNKLSYVIEKLGYPKERALSSIRFSFGRQTTKKEIIEALKIVKACLANLTSPRRLLKYIKYAQ